MKIGIGNDHAAVDMKNEISEYLKENVIIGKPIPAGTGMRKYRDVKLSTELEMNDEITLDDDLVFSEEVDDVQ